MRVPPPSLVVARAHSATPLLRANSTAASWRTFAPWAASSSISSFLFNDTATTEIYTLSLHDALPISDRLHGRGESVDSFVPPGLLGIVQRSEEHTSELQSRPHLVCRLLLEQKQA